MSVINAHCNYAQLQTEKATMSKLGLKNIIKNCVFKVDHHLTRKYITKLEIR